MKILMVAAIMVCSALVVAEEVDGTKVNINNLPSGVYVLEPYHGYLTYRYSHNGWARPIIKWEKFDLTVTVDQDRPENSEVELVIDAASIHTGSKVFDGHMAGIFLETEKYPEITVSATGIKITGPDTATMKAFMTIKEQTHPVDLDIKFRAADVHPHPMSGNAMGMAVSATAVVDGTKWFFGTKWPAPREVQINLEAELLEKAAAEKLAKAFAKVFGSAR